MQFNVNRNDLLKELGYLKQTIATKQTIPVLSHVLIKTEDDQVKMTATDLDISFQTTCKAAIKQPGELLVHLPKLNEITRSLAAENIDIASDDQAWGIIKAGKSKFRITGLPIDNFPAVEMLSGVTTAIKVDIFSALIKHVQHAITQEESQRYSLNGAKFELAGSTVRLVTTDGHRLAFIEADCAEKVASAVNLLIPRNVFKVLIPLLNDSNLANVEFHYDDNHLSFRIDDRQLTARRLSGQFPAYDLVMPKEINHRLTVNRSELISTVKRVSLLADDKSHGVKFAITNNAIGISSHSSEIGEAQDEIGVNYSGDVLKFGVNAHYFVEALSVINSDEVYLELKDEQSQAQIRPAGDYEYNFKAVVMPMRI